MAIDTLTTHTAVTDRTGLCARDLERVARATVGGRRRTAGAVVESAAELLACDTAVLLRPTESPEDVSATHLSGDQSMAGHERWRLGPRTPQLFERSCHTADGWREPWSGLRMKLRGLEVRSWAAMPLRREGHDRPLGLLAVGARDGGRPCGQMHLLTDLALSATAALAAAPADESEGLAAFAGSAGSRMQTVSNLAFGVSHSLGNIFGAILGNLQMLQDGGFEDQEQELLGRIERSTARGIELMRSLQAYSAVPTNAGIQSVDLSALAAEVAGLVDRLTGHWPAHRGVRIETDLAGEAPAWGDPRQLRESIVNLVFNAVQAVGREGLVIVRTACDGERSEVRVVDDGPGMSDEVRRRATEPFFTTHPALHQGLGLTVARGVAVGHRGSLTLHHAPIRGTEVALRLPQDPPADRRCEMAIGAALSAAAGH
ncbi:MAG: hypothetical protein GF393_09060 [Armatimonadia bacterium]|nr:hypothetical protein [Armatimonadia bacterium]